MLRVRAVQPLFALKCPCPLSFDPRNHLLSQFQRFFSFRRRGRRSGQGRVVLERGSAVSPPSIPSLVAIPPAASQSAQELVVMVRWWQRLEGTLS